MKKIYEVPICRIGYGHRTIRVEAGSEKAAISKALEVAGEYEYSEHESKYENVGGACVASDQVLPPDVLA